MPELPIFAESALCASRTACTACRNPKSQIRAKWSTRYTLPGDNLNFECPHGLPWLGAKPRSRGLGDSIAKLTKAVGIQPCGGCKERQQKLNRLVPYKS